MLLLVFLALMSGVAIVLADDAFEPNNTRQSATNIEGVPDFWIPAIQANEDWYWVFTAYHEGGGGHALLLAKCRFVDADGDIDMEVYDYNGVFLGGSYGADDAERLDLLVPSAFLGINIYYIRILGANQGNEYSLWWRSRKPGIDLRPRDGESTSISRSVVTPGQDVDFRILFENAGNVDSSAFNISVLASSDAELGSDYLIHQMRFDMLNYVQAFDETGLDSTLPFPAGIPSGVYNIIWHLDCDGEVAEAYEDNNLAVHSHTLTVVYPPDAPAPTSPANGATGLSLTPTLKATAFSDPDAGDTHANSQWQVDNSSDFSSSEWDSGESYYADTQTTVPSGRLGHSITYYWRVRYRDSRGAWSGWSSVRSFTTQAEALPAPSVTPTRQVVGQDSGQALFKVENAGGGVMSYEADESEDWMEIASGGSGGNSGNLVVAYDANDGANARTGTLTVAGGGSSVDCRIVQGGTNEPMALRILHAFTLEEGRTFYAPLVEASDGTFYGIATSGGDDGDGTIFKITSAGVFTRLHSFSGGNDGADPAGPLVQGVDGNFYGTTPWGGAGHCGTVFRVTPNGDLTTLHAFTGEDGSQPFGGLIQGSDGWFYGAADGGGAYLNGGTVFKVSTSGAFSVLHSFLSHDTDGSRPNAPLVLGDDGNFYGTTEYGGSSGDGTVFKITPAGAVTILHSFSDGADGRAPQNGLVSGVDGNFYGNTYTTIFKITPEGVLTTLRSISCSGLMRGGDGNFYGTTPGPSGVYGGTIFRISPEGVFTTLYSFAFASQESVGVYPRNGLLQGSDGGLYGMTTAGGAGTNGTLYRYGPSSVFRATDPQPAHGALNQLQTTTLSWSNGGGATSYDIYFGKDSSPDSGEHKGNQVETSYDPGPLTANTTYYWKVDPRNDADTVDGVVWSFKTQIAPFLAVSPAATNVPATAMHHLAVAVTANVSWTAQADQPWIVITEGHSGATNVVVGCSVLANTNAFARTGAIVITGGGLSPSCALTQAGSSGIWEGDAGIFRIISSTPAAFLDVQPNGLVTWSNDAIGGAGRIQRISTAVPIWTDMHVFAATASVMSVDVSPFQPD